MLDRRGFLGALGLVPCAGVLFRPEGARRSLEFLRSTQGDGRTPGEVARDEEFWREIQQAFAVDRSMVNLNNGGVSPSPTWVHEKFKQHLDFSNNAPPWHMWHVLEPGREGVRQRLAREFGCDAEEVAITRNASEGLMICQFGIDLEAGDEVLTTNQDYPRMVQTFRQRERREGVKMVQISLPVPCEDDAEVIRRFEAAVTERTKLILVCHMVNLTGQILPVKEVVALGRRHGIPVIVDGAHALAHFPFEMSDLDCDYYASSLHKWLFAPIGTGFLYVRREKIGDLWPLMAAHEDLDADIRKFEQIGTHPAGNVLAIGEALTFHQTLGPERKAARMVYLRDYWAKRLLEHERVRLNTSLKEGFACGIANVRVQGVDTRKLNDWLWEKHRILAKPIVHEEFEGLRVSPSVYTTLEELDRFCEAVEHALENGLPG